MKEIFSTSAFYFNFHKLYAENQTRTGMGFPEGF